METEKLILASASPRRQALLRDVCAEFDTIPCPLAEPELRSANVPARAWALSLAYFKARAVAEQHPRRWVLGADTVVECAGEILGKPRELEDARRMLELQAREPSDVITGLCLMRWGNGQRRVAELDVTRVWMRDDPAAREEYLQSGDWEGKAGAYGIQNVGDRLVSRIEGSFSNVVGLPVERLRRILRTIGPEIGQAAVPRASA